MNGAKMIGAHFPDDGRGRRRVYCNGVEVERCVYADTQRCVVRCVDWPIRLHRHGKRVIERTKRGKVEVFQV